MGLTILITNLGWRTDSATVFDCRTTEAQTFLEE